MSTLEERRARRASAVTRVLRRGDDDPGDRDWLALSVAERVALCWRLSEEQHALAGIGGDHERGLSRAAVVIRRR